MEGSNNASGTSELPGLVRSFVAYFTRYIEEKNVAVRLVGRSALFVPSHHNHTNRRFIPSMRIVSTS